MSVITWINRLISAIIPLNFDIFVNAAEAPEIEFVPEAICV